MSRAMRGTPPVVLTATSRSKYTFTYRSSCRVNVLSLVGSEIAIARTVAAPESRPSTLYE